MSRDTIRIPPLRHEFVRPLGVVSLSVNMQTQTLQFALKRRSKIPIPAAGVASGIHPPSATHLCGLGLGLLQIRLLTNDFRAAFAPVLRKGWWLLFLLH